MGKISNLPMSITKDKTILEKRYRCFQKWEKISVDMKYSIQHTYKIHDLALEEIYARLKEKSKVD